MKPTYILFFIFLLATSSCKKFLHVDAPPNQTSTDRVFESDATATATVTGIYSEMMNNGAQFSASGITFYVGMCADELRYYSPSDRDQFINNSISEAAHTTIEVFYWNAAYKYIYAANLTIEKLGVSNGVTEPVRKRLTGEAKFIRAFCYFYLVNLFGDVPLIISMDYRLNQYLGRSPVSSVYDQIKSDLQEASNDLPETYTNNERTRSTRWAAKALLARVYLYTGSWNNAESLASEVLGSTLYSLASNPANSFLKNNSEAIWQLPPALPSLNTWEGNYILPATATTAPTYILTSSLISAAEANDLRFNSWFSSRTYQSQTIFYPTKYKVRGDNAPVSEYYMVLRLAEQYLIRAEARVRQNKLAEAIGDINVIRFRANLPSTTATTSEDILAAIEKERRIEFAAEWGHRWLDLKRTNRANAVIGALKPASWQPTDALWPIPIKQIQANPNLTQNLGY